MNTTGASQDSVQTKNVEAFQKAVNSIVLNRKERATVVLKLPKGNIYLNNPVVIMSFSDINSHPYLTGRKVTDTSNTTIIKIEGASEIKHESNFGESTNIYYTAKLGAPIMYQGLRNSSFKNIRWEGENKFTQEDYLWDSGLSTNVPATKTFIRPDDFLSYDKSKIGWVKSDITIV